MNKRSLILFGLLLVGGGLAWLLIRWYTEREFHDQAFSEKDLAKAAARLHPGAPTQPVVLPQTPLAPSHRVRLAIGWLGLPDEARNGQVADLLAAELSGAKGLELVDRQSLGTVLRELELSLSGVARAKDAVRVGKLLRAEWFLLGSTVSAGGSNAVIARIVDARTGVMCDVGVFPYAEASPGLATKLADFVRRSRQLGARAEQRVFLAVGTLQDLSVNSRQAAFPAQLRAQLIEAYQGSSVTLLEREYVSALLQEVRLDLAGLTEESGTNAPLPMQSAYWLINGYYQSYETTNFQVEVTLDIRRIFGGMSHVSFHGKPDKALFRQIKTAIDSEMARNTAPLWATRKSEARAQMMAGKELADLGSFGLIWVDYYGDRTEPRRRNTAEAIRAFETVLLLEPTNREAKMYLAACLRKSTVGRSGEARDYYRQILEEPVQDKWGGQAQQALVDSFRWENPQEKARWFGSALQGNTNAALAGFYRQNAETAAGDVVMQSGASPKAIELAQQRLIEAVRSSKVFMQRGTGTSFGAFGMYDFVEVFGKDKATAARELAAVLPRLESEFPDLRPHLVATALEFQVEDNAALAQEFETVLGECLDHPERVVNLKEFWQGARWSVYSWCFARTNYGLAVKLMEGERRAAGGGYSDFNQQEKLKLAYAYLAVARWKDALDVLAEFSGKPVRPEGDGPWGRAFTPVLTDKLVAQCREKLGLSIMRDLRKFEMGPNCVCMHSPSTFTTDADGLWLAIAGQLLRLDFDLKTNAVVILPVDPYVPITCLCLGVEKIWLGTSGAGLIEYNKATHGCRHLTEADGLMMNDLSSLYQEGDSLWLGYGGDAGGGLGHLDLRSGKLRSFMPSLIAVSGGEAPPRQPIGGISSGGSGDLCMLVGGAIRKFDAAHDSWGVLPQPSGAHIGCFAAEHGRLVEGVAITQIEIQLAYKPNRSLPTNRTEETTLVVSPEELSRLEATLKTNGNRQYVRGSSVGNHRNKGQLEIRNFSDDHWQRLTDLDAIPNPPTAMALEGDDLWVGGEGFVARVDLKHNIVKNFSLIRAQSVERVKTGGGYVWAQYDRHLHRALLSGSHKTPLSATR